MRVILSSSRNAVRAAPEHGRPRCSAARPLSTSFRRTRSFNRPSRTRRRSAKKSIASQTTMAGGFRAYERNRLNALAAIFAPKLPRRLPPELVRRVVEYAFHAGDY